MGGGVGSAGVGVAGAFAWTEHRAKAKFKKNAAMMDNLARQHRRSGVIFMAAGEGNRNLFKELNRFLIC